MVSDTLTHSPSLSSCPCLPLLLLLLVLLVLLLVRVGQEEEPVWIGGGHSHRLGCGQVPASAHHLFKGTGSLPPLSVGGEIFRSSSPDSAGFCQMMMPFICCFEDFLCRISLIEILPAPRGSFHGNMIPKMKSGKVKHPINDVIKL